MALFLFLIHFFFFFYALFLLLLLLLLLLLHPLQASPSPSRLRQLETTSRSSPTGSKPREPTRNKRDTNWPTPFKTTRKPVSQTTRTSPLTSKLWIPSSGRSGAQFQTSIVSPIELWFSSFGFCRTKITMRCLVLLGTVTRPLRSRSRTPVSSFFAPLCSIAGAHFCFVLSPTP